MLIRYELRDQATSVLLHNLPWMDRDLREDDLISIGSTTYKVEGKPSLALTLTTGIPGSNEAGILDAVLTVLVSIPP